MKNRNKVRHCRICNKEYATGRVTDGDRFCSLHNTPELREQIEKWQASLNRAKNENLEAMLGFGEWLAVREYFGGLCAYCLDQKSKSIEHFVRIDDGGGTTINNCVPACVSCNMKKDHYRGCFVPEKDMKRVERYLDIADLIIEV